MFDAAVAAVFPEKCVPAHLPPLADFRAILVIHEPQEAA
jgi:hypothetical protein